MLVLGEIRTCLLRASAQLPTQVAEQMLELVHGRRAVTTVRPRARSVSSPLLTGVDCKLAAPQDPESSRRPKAPRVIGTVATNAIVTGGLVLQASARTRVARAAGPGRLNWSHYTAQPGVVEAVLPPPGQGGLTAARLARGFLSTPDPGDFLDLGAVGQRLVDEVQRDGRLDHLAALRTRATRVLWAAVADETVSQPTLEVRLSDAVVRTVLLTMPPDQLQLATVFSEDFALHDWLLTTLDRVIEDAERRRGAGEDPIDLVRAAVERLEHLWMPGVRFPPELAGLWPALERRAALGQQWTSLVGRIHSQIALQTLQALADARRRRVDW
jgi:hypothetical protein